MSEPTKSGFPKPIIDAPPVANIPPPIQTKFRAPIAPAGLPPPIVTSPRDAAMIKKKLSHSSSPLVIPPPPSNPPAPETEPEVAPDLPSVPPPPLETETLEESSTGVNEPVTPIPARPPRPSKNDARRQLPATPTPTQGAPTPGATTPRAATPSEPVQPVSAPTPPPPPPQDWDQLTASIPIEDMYCSDDRENEPLQELVKIPSDLVTIAEFPKSHRTTYEHKPTEGQDLENYVELCYYTFSSNWKLVKFRPEPFKKWMTDAKVYDLPAQTIVSSDTSGGGAQTAKYLMSRQKQQNPSRSRSVSSTNSPQNEMQIVEVGLRSDDPHFEYVKPYGPRTDYDNMMSRLSNRLGLFEYYDPQYSWAPGTEIALCNRITQTSNPDEKRKKKFMFRVEPLKLSMEIGVIEPFFMSLSLYEVTEEGPRAKKLKLSESFCFDLNDDTIEMMTGIMPEVNIGTRSSSGLFGVSTRNMNIYIVLEITKVFHGEQEVSIDPYIKYSAAVKDKEKEKIRSKLCSDAPEYCSKYGKFHQPFGFSVLPVYNFKSDLLIEGDCKFTQVFPAAKEPIEDLIQSIWTKVPKDKVGEPIPVTKELTKRLGKTIPMEVSFKVTSLEEDHLEDYLVLDSSLQPILDNDGETPDPDDFESYPIREIYEFSQGPIKSPHMAFINNLYLYPQSLSFGKLNTVKSVAIKIEVRDSDDLSVPSLKCIYAHNLKSGWVNEIFLNVKPKEKNPSYNEEIKILLPPSLTASHHLLISYYNVVKVKRGSKNPPVTLLGYSTHPLYVNGRINLRKDASIEEEEEGVAKKKKQHATAVADDELIALPVVQAAEVESGYLNPAVPSHLLDGGKPLFTSKYHLLSTIYPEDGVITRLFHAFGKTKEELSSAEVVKILQQCRQMSQLLAIQYMPIIIKILLEIMITRERDGGLNPPLEAFKSLVMVLHKVKKEMAEKVPRTSLLELYTNYIFDQNFGSQKPIYEALCFNFLLFMMEKKMVSENVEDSIFVNSWVMFDLIIKSMTLHLAERGSENAQNRTSLFPDSFRRALSKLLSYLTQYFKSQLKSGNLNDMRVLNRNLALFIKDLLCVFDRGIVLDMIRTYLTDMTDETQYEIASEFKFEFLSIIVDSDYYIQLNLPFGYDDETSLAKLSQKHPLAMILLYEVIETLSSGNIAASNCAIGALYDIVVKHFYNEIYHTPEKMERICYIYFALVPLLIKAWQSTEQNLSKWLDDAKIMEKRELYVIFLYVVKHINPDRFRAWLTTESYRNLITFFEILVECVNCFEYDIDHKRQTKTLMRPELALFMTEVGTDEMKNLLKGTQDKVRRAGEELERLKQLSTEMYLIILDTLEATISVHHSDLSTIMGESPLLGKIVDVYVAFMKMDNTEEFLHFLYQSLRSFAYRFQKVLFRGDNNFVGKLVRETLRHCSFHNVELNTEAATFLYILLKLNQAEVGSFNRTRIQAITSVSNLVSDRILKEDSMLKLSFSRLSDFALHAYSTFSLKDLSYFDSSQKSISYTHANFTRGVQGLGETLGTILRDTIRVKQMEETADREMIGDLYFQIAHGYMNTPDLRIEWLTHLAKFQSESEHFAEAGMCMLHVAALIADYLVSLLGMHTIDPELFLTICPGLSEFAGDEEGLCQTRHFSIDGFVAAVEKAIECFMAAHLYEFAAQLYKIMIPSFEANSDYKKLSESYEKQSEVWKAVSTNNETRFLGSYFRVGFYGEKYGEELDGSEWIYKEAGLTHLFELKDRFIEFWSKRLGSDVEVIDASKDVAKLDTSKCYIQITKVEPYLDAEDLAVRKTWFQQSTSLSRFVIVTPFSSKGKAQTDDLADQFTKKTILVVKHSFPFMLSRLPVITRNIIIIDPIDNSINALKERCTQFDEQLQLKQYQTLSQILQGTVLVMVSQGPLEICHVFLGNWQLYNPAKIAELLRVIKVFVEKCGQLLVLNKELTPQQSPPPWIFHFECLAGYEYVKSSMMEFVNAVEFSHSFADEHSDSISESFTETTEQEGGASDDEDEPDVRLHVPGAKKESLTPGVARRRSSSNKKSGTNSAENSPRRRKKPKGRQAKLSFPPPPPPETPPPADEEEEY